MKLAYAIGRTLGCGEAGYVVNAGAMSPPLNRMKAPLLPLRARRPSALLGRLHRGCQSLRMGAPGVDSNTLCPPPT